MNLVVGATGLLGGEICRRLRQRELPVRALVRKSSDPEKVAQLRKLGAEVVTGDLQDPASLERACTGVTGVVSTASTTLSRQAHDSLAKTDMVGQLNLVEAARKANVRRFVFISFSGNFEEDSPLRVAKRTAEKRLRESGLNYTILRPSCFMEVWFSPALGFDAANRKAQIFGTGERPLSFISLYDVAEFAAETLTNDAAANQTIELGGPEAVAPRDVVRIFEQEVGGPIQVTEVSEDVLRQQYTQATEEYQKTFAGLMLGVCGGDRIDMRETLKKFPVKLTSVRDFARKSAATRS
jgi:uncharacterized protein YbjT (DUF2867 family)